MGDDASSNWYKHGRGADTTHDVERSDNGPSEIGNGERSATINNNYEDK